MMLEQTICKAEGIMEWLTTKMQMLEVRQNKGKCWKCVNKILANGNLKVLYIHGLVLAG